MNPLRPPAFIQRESVLRHLGSEMRLAGLEGPVLVVAGTSAISQLAPVWAAALEDVGWKHRVRAFGGRATLREVANVAAEAVRWQARVIVGAGGGQALDAARAAATAAGVPLVVCPTVCATPAAGSSVSVIHAASSDPTPGLPSPCRPPVLVLVDPAIIASSPPASLAAGMGASLAMAAIQRMAEPPEAVVPEAEAAQQTLLGLGAEALSACRAQRVTAALEQVVETILGNPWTGADCSRFAAREFPDALRRLVPESGGSYGAEVAFGAVVELLDCDGAASPQRRALAQAAAVSLAAACRRLGLPMTLAELGVGREMVGALATGIAPRWAQALAAADTLGELGSARNEAAVPGG